MSIVEQLRFRSSCKDGIGFLPDEIVHVPARLLHLAIDEITRLTAENEKLRAALRDLLRLVDEDTEEDDPSPYLFNQVCDRARAALQQEEK